MLYFQHICNITACTVWWEIHEVGWSQLHAVTFDDDGNPMIVLADGRIVPLELDGDGNVVIPSSPGSSSQGTSAQDDAEGRLPRVVAAA